MSAYFLDANALYKYYQAEAGSTTVQALVEDNPYRCFISEWSLVEFVSAFRGRITQAGDVNAQERLRDIFLAVYQQLLVDVRDTGRFILRPLPSGWRPRAINLILETGIFPPNVQRRSLMPGDALQLVAFEDVRRSFPVVQMVTNDQKLLRVCARLNYPALDPCQQSG
jgi:hypothetical protein